MSNYEAQERQRSHDLFVARSHQQALARAAVEDQRRSAAEAAQQVADLMVTQAALNHPDVFAGRDLGPLRSLIAEWILRGE